MDKPLLTQKKKRTGSNYLPHIVIASLMYFVITILWLAQHMVWPFAIVTSLAVYIFMTAIAVILMKTKEKSDSNRAAKLLEDGNDGADKQKGFRREAWIDGLRYEAGKVHDRIFQMGAVLCVALTLYAVIMNAVFGLTPEKLFFVAWPIVALIWLVQIVFFPKWLTYTSFLVFCAIGVGLHTFGPQILMFLPNIIFLPVFYLLMMFFMYGSIMIPNLAQIKYFKPGTGNWEVPEGSTRGQFGARAVVETQMDRFVRYAEGKSDRKPTRGMVFEGPPGTGKTLLAMEIATKLNKPFVQADASAFNAPFMGFGQLIPLIVRWITEGMAREYGGAVIFIDEGENLFGARSGMQQQQQSTREVDLWDVLPTNGDLAFNVPRIRARQWNESQMALVARQAPPTEGKHGMMMMPGAMGGNSAIYPFLTWMNGANSAPIIQRTLRSLVNTLLDALFIPVTLFGKVLRLPPGKPEETNVMFITATNRFWMFDPAMIRPKRFGIVANFVIPDEDERADVAKHYLTLWHRKGYYQDNLVTPARIREFAQATPNASPAELEQMIEEAVDVRAQHVAELRRIKRAFDEGKLKTLLERDQKFWKRFKNTVYDAEGKEIPGWNHEKVDWEALMETKSSISFGRANPEAVNETTRRNVAFHELGHFLALKTFNGSRQIATLLTVVPRRGNLGMVAHIPHDTREQYPQEFYEGLIRTAVASWVTEHFFLGQGYPSVTGDLRNVTNLACLMVGKFGMAWFDCSKTDQEYYQAIGEVLISEPETSMFNPQATALLESVLKNPKARASVATIIGMAAIDAYRLIRVNQGLFLQVIPEFLELDEYSGNRLTDLWKMLDKRLVSLDHMDKADRQARPANAFAVPNTFYKKSRAEGADIYEQVKTLTEGARS